MILLGLTGSIGMGKSATAQMFRECGAPVYDADASVHGIYQPGGRAVAPVSAAFEDILDEDGGIDRAKLRAAVIGDPQAIQRLEEIVHPLVGAVQLEFLEAQRAAGAPYIVLDVPLLFETGGNARCNYVAVVSAPAAMQRERVLARGEMSEQDFEAILAKQVPDAEKRARADFIISTAFGFDFARAHVKAIADLMIRLAGEAGND
ncbi:MAG: dephospho-CoA kinase [Hyphomonadaceae bacterium]|nr:dephospho-CoA kinase [Hyphomonadaceae bacterium]